MIKKITILVYFMIFFSCNHQKEIAKISFNDFNGGKFGAYSKLEITKEHIYYVNGNVKSKKVTKEKTSRELWNNLTKVSIDDFLKVRSNPGRIAYDGTDVEITILFGDEYFLIVNGEEDTLNYKKIKLFVSLLEKQNDIFKNKHKQS
ncbi:hypothetical protein [Flavobacterium sp.]|uniref:hypothetical protein n=1 Tax=Flavobacterium sp. TaxID=239 RepID=UPI00286AE4F5|nr:hypothetical protein [Flavobacterium sp.]